MEEDEDDDDASEAEEFEFRPALGLSLIVPRKERTTERFPA